MLFVFFVVNPSCSDFNGQPRFSDRLGVYMSAGDSELQVVDVSRPASPRLVGSFGAPKNRLGIWGLGLTNDHVLHQDGRPVPGSMVGHQGRGATPITRIQGRSSLGGEAMGRAVARVEEHFVRFADDWGQDWPIERLPGP